ncbi:MAG TPA: glycosyltransferase [Pseudonocardiaceae bacterium]|nr:glycosyltransferase [Pseudonocardiaceae bacterium]
MRTVPVLAVLVCHNGDAWLGAALDALRALAPRPRHVLAVDTGSTDRTAALLGAAASGPDAVLDGVLTVEQDTGFGAAVQQALDVALVRWGDPGQWLWLLHDDCAPEPGCLGVLLNAAELSPSVGMLGPLALDWDDPRLVVEVGLSTDASGHRQTGIGPTEVDWESVPANRETIAPDKPGHESDEIDQGDDREGSESRRFEQSGFQQAGFQPSGFEQSTEVLAVSSAGALIRRGTWESLHGFDPALALLCDDLDFGWRVNRFGQVVLCVPAARLRHARAAARGLRPLDAVPEPPGPVLRSVDRAHGMRTLLVNCVTPAFVIGLPRLIALSALRALGFLLLRRTTDAGAELRAARWLVSGGAGLRAARARRRRTLPRAGGAVRGLLTSRLTRLRNLLRTGAVNWVRRRVAADVALGRLPAERASARILPEYQPESSPPIGPAALPAGALGRTGSRRTAGLRRPATAVVVPLAEPSGLPGGLRPSPRPRPSPVPRTGPAVRIGRELVLVDVGRGRIARELLLAPPVLLVLALTAISLLVNHNRLGLDLSGGGLLPAQGLSGTWSEYLATWHGVSGGSTTPAPAALAVLGILGTLLYPFGGPHAAVAVLLLGDAPLAGLLAYLATRRVAVPRAVRALLAAGYALLPPATAAVAQGRLDVVIVHILLPPVLVGVVAVLNPTTRRSGANSWLSTAATSSIGLAVIGAFAPLVHLLVLVFALVGFVVVPGGHGDGRRRVAALFAVVLLPLALLVPWPAVVLEQPSLLLSGIGNSTPSGPGHLTDLLVLDPGGPGSVRWFGALVGLAAIVAVVARPRRAVLPGVALLLLGALAIGVLATVALPGFAGGTALFSTGPGLIVAGAGLLWIVLGSCRADLRRKARSTTGPAPIVRVVAGLGVLAVLGLAYGDVLAGRTGPLRAGGEPMLAPVLTSELSATGRSVLVMATDGQPARVAAGRTPAFGDDDIAPVPGALRRIAGWDSGLRGTDPNTAKDAVANAAIAGVLFVVAPDQATAHRLESLAGELVSPVPNASAGRPVLRLQPASGAATLISTALARSAVTGGRPPTQLGVVGISPVDAAPPEIAVRVSEGAAGRLLVLAAEDEPGWQATINGQPAPITTAWGHLVGVVVPLDGADVQIWQPAALRDVLLLVQAAVLLFAALTAIPSRR